MSDTPASFSLADRERFFRTINQILLTGVSKKYPELPFCSFAFLSAARRGGSRSLDLGIGLGIRKGSARDGTDRAGSLHKFRVRKGFGLEETENWIWDLVRFVLLSL